MQERERQQHLRTAETGRSVGIIGLVMCGASGGRGAPRVETGKVHWNRFSEIVFPFSFLRRVSSSLSGCNYIEAFLDIVYLNYSVQYPFK
jgi:hypothetical protein